VLTARRKPHSGPGGSALRSVANEPLVANKPGLQFNGHDTRAGELILKHAGKLGFEGVVSKTIDAPYTPGNRGLWRKAKALNRQEFVVVGWSDPEGSRPHLGALLLGYYSNDGKLIYAGRVGTGMADKVLADLRRRLDPLARKTPPLNVLPPRKTRFGSPLVLSRVHWVEPKLVAEITYLTWTADNLLRHTVYVGLREDKLAAQVRDERLQAGNNASEQKALRSAPCTDHRCWQTSSWAIGQRDKAKRGFLAADQRFSDPQAVGIITTSDPSRHAPACPRTLRKRPTPPFPSRRQGVACRQSGRGQQGDGHAAKLAGRLRLLQHPRRTRRSHL
jgi:hypothetical protein